MGVNDGAKLGCCVGLDVGETEGALLGAVVGLFVGDLVGDWLGVTVGVCVGGLPKQHFRFCSVCFAFPIIYTFFVLRILTKKC